MSKESSPIDQMVKLMEKMSIEDKAAIIEALSPSPKTESAPKRVKSDRHSNSIHRFTPNHPRGDAKGSKPCSSSSIKLGPKENKFLDMVDNRGRKISESCKSDSEVDKILLKYVKPVPRIRESSIIDIKCCVCGEISSIDAGSITETERYKCDTCVGLEG